MESLAMRRDGGNTGGNAKTNVAEPNQFVLDSVDPPCARPLRIEKGFSIIEDYKHLPRG